MGLSWWIVSWRRTWEAIVRPYQWYTHVYRHSYSAIHIRWVVAKNGRRRFGRHHWLHQPSHCAIRFGSMAQGPKRRLAKGVPRRRRGGLGWMFQVFKSQLGGFNTSMMPELSLNLFWQFDWIGLCMFMYVSVASSFKFPELAEWPDRLWIFQLHG